jgi:hypothetical protein
VEKDLLTTKTRGNGAAAARRLASAIVISDLNRGFDRLSPSGDGFGGDEFDRGTKPAPLALSSSKGARIKSVRRPLPRLTGRVAENNDGFFASGYGRR